MRSSTSDVLLQLNLNPNPSLECNFQSFTCNSLTERFQYTLDNQMKSSMKLFSPMWVNCDPCLILVSLTLWYYLRKRVQNWIIHVWICGNIHSSQQRFNTERNITSNTWIMISTYDNALGKFHIVTSNVRNCIFKVYSVA